MGASSLQQLAALQGDIDAGDRDPGDYDPTEVDLTVPNVWHPSFKDVKPAPFPRPTQSGKEQLQAILSICRQRQAERARTPARQTFCSATSWKDTPEPFRKLIARAAGLPGDVVGKLDRDLTESEKCLLRAAAKRLRDLAESLTSL